MPKAARAVRDLARKRMQLVQQRRAQILSIESSLSRHTGARSSSNTIKGLQETNLNKMHLGEMQTLGLKANVAVMQALQVQINSLEKVLAKHCRGEPGYRLLKTVDGIGEVLASVILLETGNIERFADVGNTPRTAAVLAARTCTTARKRLRAIPRTATATWLGLLLRRRTSRCVTVSPRDASTRGRKLKRNSTVAIKAVAHKLARTYYHMLKTNTTFSV